MKKLSQVAYDRIRSKLMHGMLRSGELSEPSLAREIGISRTPIREAIRQLESEGLLEQRPDRGTFVRRPDRRDIDEIFQIRLLLEPFVASQAAQRADRNTLRELSRVHADMLAVVRQFRKAADPATRDRLMQEHISLDIAFHDLLLRSADNRRILKMIADANILTRTVGCPVAALENMLPFLVENQREHGRVLRAVRRGDHREASDAMAFHVSKGREKTLAYYDSLQNASATPGSITPA
jgi:DNA-binding GntR family transcriptional regulator